MKLPTSLRLRLLVLLAPALALTWLLATVWTWYDARHELDELLDGHLAQAAALLVVQQVRAGHEDDDDDHGVDAPLLHRYAPRVAFQVWHEGRLSMRSSNAPRQPMHDGRGFRAGLHTLRIGDEPWRVMAARGAEHDVQVYVGELLDSRASILRAVLRGGGVALAVALPVLLVAALWAVHGGITPLRRLGAQLSQRRPQDLQPLSLDGAPSEVRPLLLALNGLFERIAALLEAERRFTADAAHELRTPIAAIRTQAQVALGESDDGLRAHALRATLEGCDRATRLVEQLLTLARLEADQELVRSQVDLSALARRVAADLAPAALAKRQQLELGAEQPLVLSGNETLLAVLLRNLLDNAVRYSPAGARVKLVVDARGLQVHDSGPGMAPEDLARLGERFFRPPGQQASGSGLGWSIVRRIAAVHGLRVQVQRSAELGGLRVDLQV